MLAISMWEMRDSTEKGREKKRRKKKEGNERKKECMRVFCFVFNLNWRKW